MIFYLVVMFAHGEVLMPRFYYDSDLCDKAAIRMLEDNPKRVTYAYCVRFKQDDGSFSR